MPISHRRHGDKKRQTNKHLAGSDQLMHYSTSMFIVRWKDLVFTARAYARAVLGVVILSVFPSVCPSVTRVDCDKTKWRTADIFIPHKRAMTATLIPTVIGGRRPLPFEICAQSDPPPSKNADFDRFPLIPSQPQEIAKKVQLQRI